MGPTKCSFTITFKLEVVKFAKENSIHAAERKFQVDRQNIREWMKKTSQLEDLLKRPLSQEGEEKGLCKKTTFRRLKGGGRKPFNQELENLVLDWILTQRQKSLRVSRRMIREKAKEVYPSLTSPPASGEFKASNGWLRRFLMRKKLSLRRKTTTAQKDPEQLYEKIVSFIMYVTTKRRQIKLKSCDIVAMDETSLWFDMLSNTTVDSIGAKTVQLNSTGHEKTHATVVLAAKGDGTKLKPYIVFKKGIREVAKLQTIAGVKVVSSHNGWMDDDLTKDWISKVFGAFSFRRRMLVWDNYKCHISDSIKSHLAKFNTEIAVIPGGCAKYIQAQDVSWNKTFKARITDEYDKWLAGDKDKELTKGGNLKGPAKRLLIEWVKLAWDSIPDEIIMKSFKTCGLTNCLDGNEDDEIHCLKEGHPCFSAFELLREARENQREIDLLEVQDSQEDDEENEILIDSSDEEDENLDESDVDEEGSANYESDSD